MLELIIFFAVICFIIGILKAIWDALKDIILGILGIGIIIAAVIFLGPLVLAWLPLLLVIFVALVVLGGMITLLERWKYRSKLKELNKHGMDKITVSSDAWQKPEELGLVEIIPAGYVVSVAFYKKVMNQIGRTSTLTRDGFERYCVKCAKQFQIVYIGPFLEFLQKKNLLLPFSLSDGETYYLSKPFVTDCKNLFLKEGAATEEEFTQVCADADIAHELRQENRRLAAYILKHMLSCGEIQKVELSDLGDSLYVAKNQSRDSKMTRREISLD